MAKLVRHLLPLEVEVDASHARRGMEQPLMPFGKAVAASGVAGAGGGSPFYPSFTPSDSSIMPALDLADGSEQEAHSEPVNTRSASRLRWVMLLLGVLIILGPYYAFDNPAGTQTALRGYFNVPVTLDENCTSAQNASYAAFNSNYQLMYSLYSLPNTVLPLFGGVLVDRVGVRSMTIACSTLALLGHTLVVVGINSMNWPAIWVGRAVFGIGTESLCVAQRILVSSWFIGRELALAMGAILAFGRFGSVLNDNISALYPAEHVMGAYCVGATMCVASFLAALAAAFMDWRHEVAHPVVPTRKREGGPTRHRDARGASSCVRAWVVMRQTAATVPPALWVLCAVALVGFPPITTFNGVGTAFLTQRFTAAGQDTSATLVNATLGILYTVAAVLAPFIGALVDRLQRRGLFMMIAQCIIALCHALFLTTNIPGAAGIGLLGAAFAMFAASFWPAVALVSPADSPGIAFGIAGAIQNVGLSMTPLVVAQLQPPACSNSYACVETLFALMATTAAVLAGLFSRIEPGVPPCARAWNIQVDGKRIALLSWMQGGSAVTVDMRDDEEERRARVLDDDDSVDEYDHAQRPARVVLSIRDAPCTCEIDYDDDACHCQPPRRSAQLQQRECV